MNFKKNDKQYQLQFPMGHPNHDLLQMWQLVLLDLCYFQQIKPAKKHNRKFDKQDIA